MATWLKDHMTRQGETMNKISDGMEHLNMNMVTKVEFDEFKSKAVTVDNMKSEVAAAIEEKNQAMVDDLREAFDKKIKEFEDKAGDVAVGRLPESIWPSLGRGRPMKRKEAGADTEGHSLTRLIERSKRVISLQPVLPHERRRMLNQHLEATAEEINFNLAIQYLVIYMAFSEAEEIKTRRTIISWNSLAW